MSHNMHASTMLSPDELKDAAKVAENGMCNSVMEYPSINFARNKAEQTRFYDDSPGPYDKWVIEYGYSVGLEDADAEAARLMRFWRAQQTRCCSLATTPTTCVAQDVASTRT